MIQTFTRDQITWVSATNDHRSAFKLITIYSVYIISSKTCNKKVFNSKDRNSKVVYPGINKRTISLTSHND